MALPTLTNPDWLSNATREELEALIIQFSGLWTVDHTEDGHHGDLIADSLTVEGDAAVDENLDVTGDASVSGTFSATGDVEIVGETTLGAGLSIPDEDAVLSGGASADLTSYGTSTDAPIILRLTTANSGDTITGVPISASAFPAGLTGRFHYLLNDSGVLVHLAHNSGTSSASNGFLTPDGLRFMFPSGAMIGLWRDETDTRWRIIGAVASSGSWTPVLAFGGASVGITYGTQTGTWTRTGNAVTVEMRVTLTANGSSTGNATITGLPFTAAANPPCIIDCATGMVGLTGTPLAAVSTTTLNLLQTTATGRAPLTEAEISDTADMRLALTYRI